MPIKEMDNCGYTMDKKGKSGEKEGEKQKKTEKKKRTKRVISCTQRGMKKIKNWTKRGRNIFGSYGQKG